MNYNLDIKNESDYVLATASGKRTRKNIAAIAQEIISACEQNHITRVLVDVRELDGHLNIFNSFMFIVTEFPKLRNRKVINKAVIVDLQKRGERLRFFERVARNRGYNIRLFTKFESAKSWICAN